MDPKKKRGRPRVENPRKAAYKLLVGLGSEEDKKTLRVFAALKDIPMSHALAHYGMMGIRRELARLEAKR